MIRKAVSIAAVVLLVATGAAPAATPADVQYGEPTSSEQPPVTMASAESPDTVGALPFTGAELGMIGAAGMCIIGAGLVLRRIGAKGSRREPQA